MHSSNDFNIKGYKFLISENKGVVSTSSPESVDLHGVREWNAHDDDTGEVSDEVVDLPFRNRIDEQKQKICPFCGRKFKNIHGNRVHQGRFHTDVFDKLFEGSL